MASNGLKPNYPVNVPRLKTLCVEMGRNAKERWLHDDYADWRILDVA